MKGSRRVSSNTPRYPRRSMVYMDWMMFLRACLNVWLKAPRVIPAFVRRNRAFSSFVNAFPTRFGAKKSISRVSNCVLVRWLFFTRILMIGSFIEPDSHFWMISLDDSVITDSSVYKDTVLYTMCSPDCRVLLLALCWSDWILAPLLVRIQGRVAGADKCCESEWRNVISHITTDKPCRSARVLQTAYGRDPNVIFNRKHESRNESSLTCAPC